MNLEALNGILGLNGKEVLMATVLTGAIGWAGQHWKAPKDIPTWRIQALMVAAVVSAWALIRLPAAGHVHEWLGQCVVFSLVSLGIASGAAGVGLAPKTDSK